MQLHGERVQVGPHDDRADHALRRDPGDQRHRQPDEVAPTGPTQPGPSGSQDDGQPDDEVNSRLICSIAECCDDTSTRLESLQLRPVVAPQSGTGQPHCRAGHHDDADERQGGDADLVELRRA